MSSTDEFFKKDIAFKSDLVATPTGDLEVIAGLDNVKEALFRRILTHQGSVVHRPDYGVSIKNFQNTLSSLANQRRLAQVIKEQLEQDERVEGVSSVQFKLNALEPERTELILRVKLVGYGETTLTYIPFGDA